MDIPKHVAAGAIIGVVTIFGPQLVYWEGGDFFGRSPYATLILIAACGGAAMFAVGAEKGMRLRALVPGMLAGAGAVAVHGQYMTRVTPQVISSTATTFFMLLGATPGILLFLFLRKRKLKG